MNNSVRKLDTDNFGIEITANEFCKAIDGVTVHGAFKVPYMDFGVPETATNIPKHIALVVTARDYYSSCKPFYDVVVFEDDVNDCGKYCVGKFNLNVLNHIRYEASGEYYILCSIGTYVSNIVKVNIT